MLPRNPLLDKSRLVMELRLPMHGGIGPPRPSELRFSAMTRSGVFALHETPFQLQKSVDELIQEIKAPVGSEIWDWKQRRASRSVSGSSLVANGSIEYENMIKARRGMSFELGVPKWAILRNAKCSFHAF
jgi:hypothetical protein